MHRVIFVVIILSFLHIDGAFASDVLNNLMYKASLHDAEIEQLKLNLENQHIAIESVHQEVQSLARAISDSPTQSKIAKIDKGLASAIHDIKKMKEIVNELIEKLNLMQKNKGIESVVEKQAKQIEELEKALRGLALAMQKDISVGDVKAIYKVKSGDSLEKIAKDNGSTVQALKDANNLKNSIIHPGQELKIP